MFEYRYFVIGIIQVGMDFLELLLDHPAVAGLDIVSDALCIAGFHIGTVSCFVEILRDVLITKHMLVVAAEKTALHQQEGIFIGMMDMLDGIYRAAIG